MGDFLSNESRFGKLMTKCGTIIVLNILFVISCIPFFTVGPAITALYYSVFEMMKEEESDKLNNTGGTINPLRVYLHGFTRHFFRSTLYWLLFVGIMVLGAMNLVITGTWNSPMKNLASVIIAVMLIACIVFVFALPLHAQCEVGLGNLIRMTFQTVLFSPLRTAAALLIITVPLILIRIDEVNKPTYAFIFSFFGCCLIVRIVAKLLGPALSAAALSQESLQS